MSHCACSFLRNLAHLVIEALRLLLFLSTLIFCALTAFISLSLLGMVKENLVLRELWLAPIRLDICTLGLAALVTLLGAYGSFFRHHKSLKWFSLLLSINALVLVLSIGWSDSAHFSGSKREKMLEYQFQYNWVETESYNLDYTATQFWDQMQKWGCCGIDGPHDWDRFRPIWMLSNTTYPKSCCDSKDWKISSLQLGTSEHTLGEKFVYLCDEDKSLHRIGCANSISYMDHQFRLFGAAFVAIQLLLASIATCVGYNIRPERSARVGATNTNSNNNHYVPVYPQLSQEHFYNTDLTTVGSVYNPTTIDYAIPPPKYGAV